MQLNVECYGGGLWHTWFDRDLSLAGRVILRDASNPNSLRTQLVKIDRPVLRIPNLCIHLQSASEREAFKVNKQDHLIPILCNEVASSLTGGDSGEDAAPKKKAKTSAGSDVWASAQQPELLDLVASELGCTVEEIADFELSLYDTQGAAVSGMRGEFLCSSRLDNLASCFTALEALEAHALDRSGGMQGAGVSADEDVSIVAMFDHEEVGSQSLSGAGSSMIADAIERISFSLTGDAASNRELQQTAKARWGVCALDYSHHKYAAQHYFSKQ